MSNRKQPAANGSEMETIRRDFVQVLESPDGDDFQALVDGSHALRALNPSMSIHEASAILVDWAIQDGYFEASRRAEAEAEADEVQEIDELVNQR